MTNEKHLFLSFTLPFLLGGTYFAVIAIMQLRQLPSEINGSLDYVYAITLAYQDMGIACGIAGLLVSNICRKLTKYLPEMAPGIAKIRGKNKGE